MKGLVREEHGLRAVAVKWPRQNRFYGRLFKEDLELHFCTHQHHTAFSATRCMFNAKEYRLEQPGGAVPGIRD